MSRPRRAFRLLLSSDDPQAEATQKSNSRFPFATRRVSHRQETLTINFPCLAERAKGEQRERGEGEGGGPPLQRASISQG